MAANEGTEAAAGATTSMHRFRWLAAQLEVRMLALAILIAVVLSVASPYFLTAVNVLNLLDQSVVVGIVAIGMTFVILTGGIDLLVGSVAG
jgi:ribose transport system permease protein